MKTTFSRGLVAGALLGTVALTSVAKADIGLTLNGQPLATSTAPVQLNGRTLVPLRDIFEALGAQVNWNPMNQTIAATQGVTQIQLGINNPNALVNGRSVKLDQPAAIIGGKTFVPLRFVAEATGAQVDWNNALQLVSIRTPSNTYPGDLGVAPVAQVPPPGQGGPLAQVPPPVQPPFGGSQVGGYRELSIPARSVVPVQLDTKLSSADTRVGTTFTATVVSRRLGDSEFPPGTKLEGRVIESRPSEKNQPGVLDFDFQAAVLPDGTRIPLRGQLASLDSNNVQQQDGRLVADGAEKSDRLKVVGIGAGAGYVLGRVLDTNSTLTTVLGAAGGYLFSRSRDKKAQEATIAQNATFGVELNDRVRYQDAGDYGRFRSSFLRDTSNSTNARYNPRDYGFDESAAGRPSDRYDGYDVSDRMPDENLAPLPTNPDDRGVGGGGGRGPRRGGRGPRDNANVDQNGFPLDNNAPIGNNGFPRDNTAPRGNGGFQNGDRYPDDGFGGGGARVNDISIPAGAIVPVTLDRELSSATARVGDEFTATVFSQKLGDSEFPSGTKVYGRVVEAQPRQGDQPGVLDLEFRSAQLPTGERVPLTGVLTSLDPNAVQTQDGRIIAKAGSNNNNDRLKVIGIGAAAGFVVGRVIKKNGILPSLLGALGGYIFSTQKGDKPAEAIIPTNAQLGVRLDNRVSYTSNDYYGPRTRYLKLN